MNRIIVNGKNERFSCFIRNNITGTIIYFPVTPEGITENQSANFTQQDIIGASRPRIIYSSTGAKTISLSLRHLTEDYIMQGFTDLLHYVRCLQALVYPDYEAGIVKAPDLTLVLGDRSMSCVCTNVSVNCGDTVKEQRITYCDVELSLLMTRPGVNGATHIELKG